MKFFLVLIIVLSAVVGMRFIRLIIKQLINKYVAWSKLLNLLPLASLILWIIILFWAVNYLFRDKSYYQLIIISIIVILSLSTGWFFLKDIIAGVFFRIQNNYSQNEFVQFGKISGRLNEMHLTHISIQTNDGRSIKIPYSRLSNEIISQRLETKSFENDRLIININKKHHKKETEDIIFALISNSPWRIGIALPTVKFLKEDPDHYSFELQVQVRNQKHLDNINDSLLKRFS
jgi:hypothetical protein